MTVAIWALCAILLSSGAAFAGPAAVNVPEPASLALLAGALGALMIARARRK